MHLSPFMIPIFGMALGALGIVGWMFTTWLRVKHGYPLDDGAGNMVEPGRANELLTQENEQLRGKIGRLEERLSVLERIATDPATRLDREIESLRQSN